MTGKAQPTQVSQGGMETARDLMAAHHASPSGRFRQDADRLDPTVGGETFIADQDCEGFREQAVPREDGLAFAEGHVAGGFAAPQVVIVHGGQVIVDEGLGVDVFQGRGAGEGDLRRASERFGGQHAEHRTHALAPGFEAVAHGLAHPWGFSVLQWTQEPGFEQGDEAIQVLPDLAG